MNLHKRILDNLSNAVLVLDRRLEVTHELLGKRIAPEIRPARAQAHPGELRFSVADISRLSTMTGYRPRGTLEDRIDEVIESCKTTPGA